MSFVVTLKLRRAVKAGAVSYAVALLTIALFATPIVGTHLDFGHTHPQNSLAHTHAISDFFSATSTTTVSFAVLSFVVLGIICLNFEKPNHLTLLSTQRSRAPPVIYS